MAASGDLTTAANVKSYLGITASTYDTILGNLVASASEAIERYCRAAFTETEYTEYYDGDDNGVERDRILLKRRPVISVTSVYDDVTQPPTWPAGDVVDSDDYAVYLDEGIVQLYGGNTFNTGQRNVRVIYVAGYVAIPTDIEQACNMLVADWFHRGHVGADGFTSENVGGDYSYSTEPNQWPAAVKAILGKYRNVAI